MIYEYLCSSCGEITTARRKIAERKNSQSCRKCGSKAEFIISTPHVTFDPADPGFAGNYSKWGRNRERQAAEQ